LIRVVRHRISLKLSMAERIKYIFDSYVKTISALQREFGNVTDVRADTLLLGGFHAQNLGDLALGKAVSSFLSKPFNAEVLNARIKYSGQRNIILGGGSVITERNVELLRTRGFPAQKVVAVGVDLWPFVKTWKPDNLSYLRDFRLVSVRSHRNFELAINEKVIDKDKLRWSFDNAFSLLEDFQLEQRDAQTIGINVLPHLHILDRREFQIGGSFADKIKARSSAGKIFEGYVHLIRDIANKALDEGKLVQHLPFSPEDCVFARKVLSGLSVEFLPFTTSVQTQLARISALKALIATRYHSMVFGLGLGVPTFSIAYSGKCENLVYDLGVPNTGWMGNCELENICVSNSKIQIDFFKLNRSVCQTFASQTRGHLKDILCSV